MNNHRIAVAVLLVAGLSSGCATTETSRAIEPARTAAAATPATGAVRAPIAVGNFDNRPSFGRGIFADGGDRLGSQSKTILVAHLQQSNRFSVLDRENLADARQEAALLRAAAWLERDSGFAAAWPIEPREAA